MAQGTFAQYVLRQFRDPRIRTFARTVLPASVLAPIRHRLLRVARHLPRNESFFSQVLSSRDRMAAIPDRVVMVCGSLGPGGAERQIVNTLRGLAGAGVTDRFLLCETVGTGDRNDFYLTAARETG